MSREIQLGDLVRNTNGNDISGYVIAKFTSLLGNKTYLDIRTEERIYYTTPIENWATVAAVEDLE